MKQRIITAVIAAAIFLPIVVYGKAPFTAVIYLLATVGLYELLRMKRIPLLSIPGIISLVLLWIFLLPSQYSEYMGQLYVMKIELALFGVLLFLTYTVVTKNRFTFDDVAFATLGTLYVGIGFYYFIETRAADSGLEYLFFALFVVWATDSGAYFVGRAIGKRKLWPDISPNKTIEGFVGGIVCALIVGFLFIQFSTIDAGIVQFIIVTIILSVFGQIGDLVESALKRHYDVKDSGNILPGHGGVLDRFDSLLFVLPLLHILQFI
ncbi:phosphatidate cytidylyltransferase [Mangrovibacillus cuniculi]|uniref:Phosphatidate cytidylyltransferase n=1 Tax=Mangrovibacillus cuniculi TaxID=2593652 RepID=A0A7S8CAP1_9BACI|nr:phosphatidate cytidylyltransferase [Mangrovibacillus cuniculi]QPC46376.1 phosphatidate cytidylyltransferase [Mangrovibacillus cuniculi]